MLVQRYISLLVLVAVSFGIWRYYAGDEETSRYQILSAQDHRLIGEEVSLASYDVLGKLQASFISKNVEMFTDGRYQFNNVVVYSKNLETKQAVSSTTGVTETTTSSTDKHLSQNSAKDSIDGGYVFLADKVTYFQDEIGFPKNSLLLSTEPDSRVQSVKFNQGTLTLDNMVLVTDSIADKAVWVTGSNFTTTASNLYIDFKNNKFQFLGSVDTEITLPATPAPRDN